MIIRLDPAAPTHPAEQLVHQIAAAIRAGDVAVGERLPTIRSLAADLGLAPGTVARAYAELERDGWVHTQGRRGTVVADRSTTPRDAEVDDAAAMLAALVVDSRIGIAEAHRALDLAVARLGRAVGPSVPRSRR